MRKKFSKIHPIERKIIFKQTYQNGTNVPTMLVSQRSIIETFESLFCHRYFGSISFQFFQFQINFNSYEQHYSDRVMSDIV